MKKCNGQNMSVNFNRTSKTAKIFFTCYVGYSTHTLLKEGNVWCNKTAKIIIKNYLVYEKV